MQWFVAKNRSLGIAETATKVILHNIRVFAVDQTVNRTADGEEAPTLAKTISLLLTPQQASKLTLASKVGEVSLIPRHPDDEDTPDSAEVSFDELLHGSEKGSREREQLATDGEHQQQQEGFFASLFSKAKSGIATAGMAAAQPKPPWVMEIVSGDEVEFIEFSPIDGRPLQAQKSYGNYSAPRGTSTQPAAKGATKAIALPPGELPDELGTSPAGGEGNEDDFPIDL